MSRDAGAWDRTLQGLIAYRAAHGHCQVPVRWPGQPAKLGYWCNQQRYLFKKGRLAPERVARLAAVGFFDASEPTPQDRPGVCTNLDTLVATGQRFGTIYADPPWNYRNQNTRSAAQDHYDGMTLDALVRLPVKDLAADNAHLHLWITSPFLLDAKQILDAWGFTYKSSFVWTKKGIGMGNYWRISHEHLLLGVKGNAKSFKVHNLKSHAELERSRHSAKPERIRHMIEKASPGPFLELFGRRTAPGWTVFGNQVAFDLFDNLSESPASNQMNGKRSITECVQPQQDLLFIEST